MEIYHVPNSYEIAMTVVSGFVLIIVSLANTLSARAGCCNCNCHNIPVSSYHESQLRYVPAIPIHRGENSLETHQSYHQLGALSLQNIAHLTQVPVAQGGYEHGRYAVTEQGGSGATLELDNKLQDISIQRQQLLGYGHQDQGHLDSSLVSDSTFLRQPKLSKVSTHQDTHYINIEQHVSPYSHESDEKKDHHGKGDHYKFEYAVHDQKTHDIKAHKEEKNGDVVKGEYSLVEDNGNIRTVKYYADWKTGFHAQVFGAQIVSRNARIFNKILSKLGFEPARISTHNLTSKNLA